jgi:hypothetical protein
VVGLVEVVVAVVDAGLADAVGADGRLRSWVN